jgi:hypothetical protein
MPQIVVLALGAISLFFAYRWFRAEARRVDTALKRAQTRLERRGVDTITPLALDTNTGVYSPIKSA